MGLSATAPAPFRIAPSFRFQVPGFRSRPFVKRESFDYVFGSSAKKSLSKFSGVFSDNVKPAT
jgi:hypothetical protein